MNHEPVRPWVARLGSYLRIFGPPSPGTQGWRTLYLDHLEKQAKERELEFGPKNGRKEGSRTHG